MELCNLRLEAALKNTSLKKTLSDIQEKLHIK